MRYDIFSTPVWVEKIEPSKIQLTSTNLERKFHSGVKSTISELRENNNISDDGLKYLLNIILKNLSDLNIIKISLTEIWKNVYENDFQDMHFHAGAHFSFVVYEKLKEPQSICPKVQQNDIIIFPAYLKHMVKKSQDSITISGNINIV